MMASNIHSGNSRLPQPFDPFNPFNPVDPFNPGRRRPRPRRPFEVCGNVASEELVQD
ncbi:MAG: hypothetical protein JSW53_05495 [Candidatus Bathyarchaeota archaeon]|nr:MAG: hypothetical protein JSW53_05495 [Candidatus Bathyarchaeota archaeon]